jgi:hypothetical protein
VLTLSHGAFAMDVTGADPAPLLWLAEFFSPALEVAGLGSGRASIGPAARALALELDASRFAELERARPPPGATTEVESVTLDGEVVRWPSWLDARGARVVHDAWASTYYLAAPGSGAVTAVAAEDRPRMRVSLMRVVREMATAHALRRGDLHLHAAAVAVGGRAVAFAGPRRSGKSTLLVHALVAGGARYLTNDRLLVAASHEPPIARGMPTIVALRPETLDPFPELRARIDAGGYERHLTLAEAAAARAPETREVRGPLPPTDALPRPAPTLTPAQLCAVAGVEAAGAAPLASIVFPRIAPEVPGFEVRPLASDEAAARLRASLLLGGLPERSAAAFDGPEPPFVRDETALAALCAAVTGRVRCVDLRLGPDAYVRAGSASGVGWTRALSTVILRLDTSTT